MTNSKTETGLRPLLLFSITNERPGIRQDRQNQYGLPSSGNDNYSYPKRTSADVLDNESGYLAGRTEEPEIPVRESSLQGF